MNDKQFPTPILFLIFNRPETTTRVFEQIRTIKPARLFVSADGPRPHRRDESERCRQTRAIIKNIDWDCEVRTHFSEKNQGCKIGVSSGITWFFENVEEGIILEDDCLPDPSFFNFCRILLERYRHNERVMEIGGVQHLQHPPAGKDSYYFSQLTQIWGWATWRRAWNTYDVTISSYPKMLEQNIMPAMFPRKSMRQFWKKKFDLAYHNGIDTWDIQWQYAMSTNNGLAIIPKKNMVSNIGFEKNATHTIDSLHALANRPAEALHEIVHPESLVTNTAADFRTFRKFICPNKFIKLWGIIRRFYSTTLQ